MNRRGFNVGQASRLPSERASGSDSVPSALPTEAGETPALPCGSWKASFRFCACIGTMNRDEAAAVALASWTAAVLCRFCALAPDSKALEDWRTPKPGGAAFGSWKEDHQTARVAVPEKSTTACLVTSRCAKDKD